ncbi:2-oxoacid:ferredoxin oxidoreductase subunit beta [Clostridium sp. YIM B02515]|jgi:2-oxoglutarate ferredoxin oxidoreductase subunit beta|uniref:2-oxoacid:ferredoxin oxidoreductase subunit beta n=1 Tax=Clostridium rhizosphaerae TaxID=2803861 RepID=A0ABS1TFW0_9CLOT|nr:2-oxoacid:ferredoxin oxidoreductase subunit beta [Clostridium rhizosphaerae]MBL4938278.1 2-oxoacid:ferredoxin oxidoreductase subunit beta [Clostridium rhizosphaerae]
MLDIKMYDTHEECAWCPGCGDFAILAALKEVLAELELKPHEVVVSSGIGQAAKLPHYINVNGFNGLHGRAVPPAVGIKLVNQDLKVIINSGDGDSYGEGGNHLLHNIRRNIDITHFVHDNQIYGLTKGQGSPTTDKGQKTSMQFDGTNVEAFRPLAFALTAGATFVARSFSGDKEHLKGVMKAAILHKGYALVDILQPCVTFNHVNTFKWYKENTYKLDENYDYNNKAEAIKKAMEWDNGIPLGIIYKEESPEYTEVVSYLTQGKSLVQRQWKPQDARVFMEDFR